MVQSDRLWNACQSSNYVNWQLRFILAASGCEGASLLLLDSERSELVFCASQGLNAEGLTGHGDASRAARVPLSASAGINSMAALFGKPFCMQSPDHRHDKTIDECFSQVTESVFAVPLSSAEGVIATVSAINAHAGQDESHHFTPEDRAAIEGAAEAIRLWLLNTLEVIGREPQDLSAS